MSRSGRRALLAVAALAAGAAAAAAWGFVTLRALVAPVSADATPVVFSVPAGATLGEVASELEAAGLVRRARPVVWLGRLHGLDRQLRAGEYELSPAMDARTILERIASGRVRTLALVVPEGLSAREIAARVGELGLADPDAFLAVVRDPASPASFGVEGPTLEGYLFPETYQLPRGLAPRDVAKVLVDEFLRAWAPLAEPARAQGFSMREVVTLASIVEKETGAAGERPLVASVFRNRLARGMRLDSDPTVIYGIAGFDGNLRRVHLEDERNPYNTYRIVGLPPGPIASPGAAALRAVVEPAESDYLYFVSRNDGTHVFSRTLGEHVSAVNRFQRARATGTGGDDGS